MKTKSTIIQESAVFTVPENLKRYKDGKVIAEVYLQEADTRNQNKRIYPKTVLDEGMRRVDKKIRRRAFLGELDHPITDNQVRQTTVLYKECSHVIREWSWQGNLLKAVIETLPYTQNGKAMSGFISDSIPVGFSLRGLADVEDMGDHQLVQAPLVVITFDCVSEPSNVRAIISEVRQESVLRILNEAKNMITLSDGSKYTPNSLDYMIEQRLLKIADHCK